MQLYDPGDRSGALMRRYVDTLSADDKIEHSQVHETKVEATAITAATRRIWSTIRLKSLLSDRFTATFYFRETNVHFNVNAIFVVCCLMQYRGLPVIVHDSPLTNER